MGFGRNEDKGVSKQLVDVSTEALSVSTNELTKKVFCSCNELIRYRISSNGRVCLRCGLEIKTDL